MSVLADHRAEPGHAESSVRGDRGLTQTRVDDVEPPSGTPRRLRPEQLRADFGAHFEANYQRLVAQLYAITLNPDRKSVV